MEDAGEDPTTFAAHSLPSDPRLLATVTNAYLGTRVFHDTLHVSGVYNGAGGDTHRAMLPSPLNVRLEAPAGMGEQLTETFALDTNTGSFLHTLEGPHFRASQCIYAHRTLPHVLAFRVSIARLAPGSGPITLLLRSVFSPESPDLDLHQGPDFQGARYLYGQTLTPEQPWGPQQEVHMLWTPAPPDLTLGEGEEDRTWDFLTAVGSSQAEAQACLTEALQLQARGALYTAHTQAWAQLWAECGLDMVGPLPLRQALRGSLYYLLSALPQPKAPGYICHGLSPGGLSNGSREECYWGHVFWDQNEGPCSQDLWMFPNILMFHPEAARAILEYRIRTLGGALENAQNLGYQDLQLFREAGGWDVVRAVAEFWCSRVEWSPREEEYHLRGVMSPDEYHSGVNNSVYTNVLVQNSLRFAAALAQDLGLPIPSQWLTVADKIKVPFDVEQNFHPEFDGYEPGEWTPSRAPPLLLRPWNTPRVCPGTPPSQQRLPVGEVVKQADVVLLGYPVPFSLSPDVRRKNLEIYEAVTSPQGPAMTWSMFAVGWMELKDAARAWGLLDRSFANVAEPFKVWTENADGSGAVNFLTGMGGFLQAVVFGCTGFRVTRAGVTFDPVCLPGISRVSVSGIFYQGNKLNFSFSEDSVTVEVTARAGPWAPHLEAELWPSQSRLSLLPGHKVSFPCSAGRIQRSPPKPPGSSSSEFPGTTF
ncbi:protein-glucosylgalactosylhydroxylysine glucosidase isoform X5 [Hylobates moloch]|uniref:protein-glucosylgalactosylhydroxylysine glucosidase isoform X5 n=1 Tax=Hylobates moloch TaxID=81572 RepID=UPI0013623589|nr:protein-glucosylgalactosylhydroxylysine glucosidase isoform X5 [Hylobates moloch]